MDGAISIYYPKRLPNLLDRISKIPKPNSDYILRYSKHCKAEGIKENTVTYNLLHLYRISCIVKHKDLNKLNRDDIVDIINELQNQKKKKVGSGYVKGKLSNRTIDGYKITMRKFWRFLKNIEKPEETDWLKIRSKKTNDIRPEDVWTQEEILKFVEAGRDIRERAFAFGLYESGTRIGEWLGIKIKDVNFDQDGTILNVDGKTGPRRVRIVASSHMIAQWLDVHPNRKENSYLWLDSHGDPMSHRAVRVLLMKLRDRCGVKKQCNPHLMRHSRATYLATKLTDPVMKEYFGWSRSSTTPSLYTHLSGKTVDNCLLSIYGKKIVDENENKIISVQCNRCKGQNMPNAEFCNKCGFPLSEKKFTEMLNEQLRNAKIVKTVEYIANKYPEFDKLIDSILERENVN